jgi:hypothetical protein
MAGSVKLLAAVILVPFACLLAGALALKLAFLCVSRRGIATVTKSTLYEVEDSDGDMRRNRRISIRYEVAGRSYQADGFEVLVDYAVDTEVPIRYRRSDPQDVHVGYWSSLWSLAVIASLVSSFAWFAVA